MAARLRDWQLQLLEQLIAAEDISLEQTGRPGELQVIFVNGPTIIRHPGLANHLQVPDGDIVALRDCGAIHVGIEGPSLWRGELSASARALAEAEREVRGQPTPASEVTRLNAAAEAAARERSRRRHTLASDLVRPVRWLVLLALALLAVAVAFISAAASGSPGGAVGALIVVGALWGLAERVGGWHIVEAAHMAEEWSRLRLELWLDRRLEPRER